MELISDIWDKTTDAFTAVTETISEGLVRVFGNSNERQIRRMRANVVKINALESAHQVLTDEELRAKTVEFRERLAKGETLDDLLVEAFAVCREGGRRFLKMRHYDVQLMGGMVLHGGNIAEMVTGEGKTLVATLAAYLNALEGKGVHVVTVNDYLARRDAEWMSPLYNGLGLTVGAIQSDMESDEFRQDIYGRDITYGTNNEFGFDYLRDNMKPTRELQAQGPLNYADHRRSRLDPRRRGPHAPHHLRPGVRRRQEVRRGRPHRAPPPARASISRSRRRSGPPTSTTWASERPRRSPGVESFYTPGNMEWPHLIDNALKAHHLYQPRPRLRRHERTRSSSSTSSPAD